MLISNDSVTGTVYIDDLKKVYATKFKQWPEEKQKQLMSLNYQSIDRENSPRDKVFAKFLGILRDNLKSLRVFDVNQDGLFLDCSRFNHCRNGMFENLTKK